MRLIDVDAIPEKEMNYPVWVCLKKQPTIDAIPVIRCRECIHYEPCEAGKDFCCFHAIGIVKDDFCSYGERKEDN